MFVNDTSRLPDSGRVCVQGFDSGKAGARTFYSLLINAARAEVEPMGEPRNPAHVLGVGSEIPSVNGPVFAAYFASSRERFDAQPDYKSALFVLVDGAVYAVKAEQVGISNFPPDLARTDLSIDRRLPSGFWGRGVAAGCCTPRTGGPD